MPTAGPTGGAAPQLGANSGSRLIGGGKPLLEPASTGRAQDIANKKAAQTGAAFLSQWRLSRRVACGVLRIADRVVGGALRLVHLALGLHLLVTRHLAGRVLDGTQ
jgi:hypothetical protein